MFKAAPRSAARAACVLAAFGGALTLAPAYADQLPEIVVTADRVEEPIGQTGASVTVIRAAEVEKLGTKGVADVLRGVAGLDVDEAGGVGSATQVHLRGANPGQTLVLIDGVRIGDAAATDGSVDFGNLAPVDIDRIEILRGPQSALYGSDAMGGVINIITRKGGKTPRRNVTVEAGSYGTLSTRATLSGGDDRWTYSLGVNLLHSDGFPRYGYRIDRPLVDRRRRHAAAAAAGRRPDQQGRARRPLHLQAVARRDDRRRLLAVRQRAALRQSLRLRRLRRVQPLQPFAGADRRRLRSRQRRLARRDAAQAADRVLQRHRSRHLGGGGLLRRPTLHVVQLPQRLSSARATAPSTRATSSSAASATSSSAPATRPRPRARRRTPIPTTARSRRSARGRSPIRSSPSIASRCSTGSTSRSAAASTRSRAARPSTPGARRRPTISTRRERSCAPAPARAPRRRRSTSVSASSASPASRRSRASASTPASTRSCSTAARRSRRPSSTRAIAI